MLTSGQSEYIPTMGSNSRRKRKFEWNEISLVPNDTDTLEEKETVDSLTVHSASYKNLRLMSTSISLGA